MPPSSFRDRADAGAQLAERLVRYAGEAVVLGLPRGGVTVAAVVARRLDVPLGVVVARKLRTPGHDELAMGALAVWGERVATVRTEVPVEPAAVARAHAAELAEARTRAATWAPSRPTVAGRVVIVVDDGLATGATMRAALDVLRDESPRRLVAAVPVGAAPSLEALRSGADEVVSVLAPRRFGAVGAYYADFRAVPDDVVTAELHGAGPYRGHDDDDRQRSP